MPDVEKTEKGDSSIKLNDELRSKLVNRVSLDYEQSSASRLQWLARKEEGMNLYWGIRRPKEFPFKNCSNLHIPLIRTMCDTLHSNLMGSLDFENPTSVIPIGAEDVPKARKTQKLLNWQFTAQVDYADLCDKLINTMLAYGPAPVKIRYVLEKDGDKTVYDGLKVDVLLPERVLVPPDAASSDTDDMEYLIHEIPKSKSDIRLALSKGIYSGLSVEDLDKLNAGTYDSEMNSLLENIREIYSGLYTNNQQSPKKAGMPIVIEWYGSFDIDGKGIDTKLMVTMLDKKIIRAVRWPRKRPIVIVNFSNIFGRPFGESVSDLIGQLNQEINILHNQDIDAATFQNIPFFFFDPISGFDPDKIQLSPGVGIPTNGPPSQAVYFPSLNITRGDLPARTEVLFGYAERMLGAGANTQGIIQPKKISATEIATIDKRAGIRFLTIFNRIKKGLTDIFSIALDLDKEFMSPKVQVRITGLDAKQPLFETMTKDDLAAKVDIIVNGNSIVDEQAAKQEMNQAYQLGMMNPLIARNEQAIYELTKDMMLKLGVKRIDSYLPEPQQEIPMSPDEEHNLFLQEEYTAPHLSENTEKHLKAHAELINSDSFKLLSNVGQKLLIRHFSETNQMKATIEQIQKVNQLQQVNQQLMMLHTGQHPMQQGMEQQQPPQGPPNAQ